MKKIHLLLTSLIFSVVTLNSYAATYYVQIENKTDTGYECSGSNCQKEDGGWRIISHPVDINYGGMVKISTPVLSQPTTISLHYTESDSNYNKGGNKQFLLIFKFNLHGDLDELSCEAEDSVGCVVDLNSDPESEFRKVILQPRIGG